MYLGKEYIAGAAVEYRIEVRLTDCAICRFQSLLSSPPVSPCCFLRVVAVHIKVVGVATEGSAWFALPIFHFIARSFIALWLIEHVSDGGFEGCLISVRSFKLESGERKEYRP